MDTANLLQWRHYQAKIIPYLLLLVLSFISCQGATTHQSAPTATPSPTISTSPLLTIHPALFSVNNVVWSPDGKSIAITNADGLAQVWNAATGRLISTHDYAHAIYPSILGWSADSQHLISTTFTYAGPVVIWNANIGKTLVTLLTQAAPLAASHDGKHIATMAGNTIQVWDTSTGHQVLTIDIGTDVIDHLVWSPDGQRLVSAVAGISDIEQVWDATTGNPLLSYNDLPQLESYQNNLVWSPDGEYLASVNDKEVIVWKATTDQHVASIATHHQVEYTVNWSPDGMQITAEDGATFDEGFWKTSTGEHIGDTSAYHEDIGRIYSTHISALAWSSDGMNVASTGYSDSPSALHGESDVSILPSSPIVCQGPPCIPGGSHTDLITALSWSPNSKYIASASLDKTVVVYDIANQKNLVTYHGHTGGITAVAWSPDGKRIASGSADKTIQVWDATNGVHSFTLRGHTAAVTSVAWSPDGKRIATASQDGSVRVWDALHHILLLTYHGHSSAVEAVTWSPDGTRLASASADMTVQVWNATTGNTVLTYRGHTDIVYSAAWSPDGTRIASTSKDGTIQLWCVSSSHCKKMP